MRISYMLFTAWTLLIFFSLLNCSDYGQANHQRTADPMSGMQLYQWMKSQVELMVKHKANCGDMAQALIQSQFDVRSQLESWKAKGAGEWLKQHAQINPQFDRELTRLIAKGDLVYYHCAYQEAFRNQLRASPHSSFIKS